MTLLQKGAEADLYLTKWNKDNPAVAKIRKAKPYRNSVLDEKIRRQRTVREAKIICQVKQFGITSPLVYFVDYENSKIIMQRIGGEIVRDIQDEKLEKICGKLGKIVATLHKNELMHGDLTTSNFILVNPDYNERSSTSSGTTNTKQSAKEESKNVLKQGIALIDFGLSQKTSRTEDYAVDLRLFKEILSSAHVKVTERGWKRFLSGYRSVAGNTFTDRVLKQLSAIEGRGRYATVV